MVKQTGNGHTIDFIYDENNRPRAMIYDGTTYLYELNLQGDVIGIVNKSGTSMAKYAYDAWGKIISSSGSLANVNPLRYRGYYYDTDTELYYLGSRYYDPAVKRFINADNANLITANPYVFTDKNLFAYCDNNPVMRIDDGGEFWHEVLIGVAVVAGVTAVAALAVATAGISVGAMAVVGGGTIMTVSITSASATALTVSSVAAVVSATAAYCAEAAVPIRFYGEHTNGSRPSTKNKHEEGQARKQRQEGGDKKRKRGDFQDRSNKRNKNNSGNKYTTRVELLY